METVGEHATVVATRCPDCGRRSVSDGICSSCGAGNARQREIVASPARSVAAPQVSPVFAPALRPAVVSRQVEPSFEVTVLDRWLGSGGGDVRGRVIIVQQGQNEPMDFDPWRWVAIPVWGIVLLISPLVVAIFVWQSFGALPAVGVAACSLLVLRFIFSDRLLQSWHLTAALNGRHIVEPMPVAILRLRMSDNREVQLRLKGQLIGGTVMEGDRIAAFGSWRSGVLHTRRIQCERTGATIVPRQPCARGLALVGLCVLVVAGLWIYLAGVPWVSGKVQSFRSSVQQRIQTVNTFPDYRP